MNLAHVANVVRGISADGVQKANSGHPGLPLGCAEIGTVMYFNVLRHNPKDPSWPNRDRFVLSAGHGSMLLYSLLHLTGYNLPYEELQKFRQFESLTPGHPEFGHTEGVETTTGPLGQGIGNAVGMAIAERMLAERYNKPEFPIVDYYTYALAGDGDMMEGVSAEASSLAGHLKLGKLIVFYDSNGITIEGSTEIAFTETVKDRYAAYGWHVQEIDGHDINQVQHAIAQAKQESSKPSFIVAKTQIGKGAPTKVNSATAHGAPLGQDEIDAMKDAFGLPRDLFYISDEVKEIREQIVAQGEQNQAAWDAMFKNWGTQYPQLAKEWQAGFDRELPAELVDSLPKYKVGEKLATRQASGKVLNAMAKVFPHLVGGSADLAPSNNTYLDGYGDIQANDFSGRNFNFGVREHGMAAVLNGLSLAGGFRVFGATFLVFSDYLRPSVRLSALMNQPVIYVLTHDSIYVGEDGPTHQPVEHTEALRLIPGLHVYRPADAQETADAWLAALQRVDGPSAIILTRQGLPVLEKPEESDPAKGGYVVYPETKALDLTLVAAGSEVSLAVEAAKILEQDGLGVRVVSVLCREEFMSRDKSYRDAVIPPTTPILAIEVGVGSGWYSVCPGANMRVFSLDEFGRSGPGEQVADFFGFVPEKVGIEAKKLLG